MFTVIIVVCSLKCMCVPNFIVIGYCVTELHGMAIYCNVLPEDVYCCFTRITLFTKLFTCLYDQSLRLLSHHQALLLYILWFLRYIVAKCIARSLLIVFYMCTRTTLVTKLFTCFYDQRYRLLSHHQVLLLHTFWFLR